jgi:hypothetical protein
MLGDHTMAILSSAELASVHVSDSPGAQQKSVGGAVCPFDVLSFSSSIQDWLTYLHARKVVPEDHLLHRQVFALDQ